MLVCSKILAHGKKLLFRDPYKAGVIAHEDI